MTGSQRQSESQGDSAAGRPLVVTGDPLLLEELLRLAAAAGVDVDAVADPMQARRYWAGAPLVVLGCDLLDSGIRAMLPRRQGVVLVGSDLDDAGIWQRAVEVGAEHVVFLPDAEGWLQVRLAEASEGSAVDGVVVGVLGGRGGAGATTLAAALAVTAARSGRRALLVDGDPLGGGIDMVFGGEREGGLRWPDLGATRGRLPTGALTAALPRMQDLPILSWDRGEALAVPPEAMEAVLAAGRRAHELVVVDLPRGVDPCTQRVLEAATLVLLVVPAEVRAAAAASRMAVAVSLLARDVRLVVRGPAPTGLAASRIAAALALPLLGEIRAEPGLEVSLDRGEAPARTGRGPLWALCTRLLDEVLPPLRLAG